MGGALAVRALDELPLVALLGAAASGETVVAGAGELRVKESDRVAAAVRLVRALGGDGRGAARRVRRATAGRRLQGGVVDGRGRPPHRHGRRGGAVAARAEVAVDGFEAVEVSWPGFGEALEGLWS